MAHARFDREDEGSQLRERRAAPPPAAAPRLDERLRVAMGAGNQAFCAYLARQGVLARDPVPDVVSGADPASKQSPMAGKAVGAGLEARVAAVQKESIRRRESITDAVTKSIGVVDAMRVDLEAYAVAYEDAWAVVKKKIEEGKAKAKSDEALAGLVMNVAIGVGIGLGVGGIIAVAEKTGRMALTAKVVLETTGEGLEWVVGQAISGTAQPNVKGTSDAFERAHPGLKRADAYEKLAALYRRLALLGLEVAPLARISDACGPALRDTHEVALNGRHSEHSNAKIEAGVAALERAAAEQAKIEAEVTTVLAQVGTAATEAKSAKASIDPRQLQKHIWIHWMASLSGDDVDLLDADPIEDELHALKLEGLSSQIGWSTGAWHSSSDSEEGVRKARMYSMALGMVGKTGTFHLSGNRPYARTPVKPEPGEARELGVITMDSEPTGADAGMWPKWDFEIAVQDGAREGDKVIVAGVFAASNLKQKGVRLYGRRLVAGQPGAAGSAPAL
jgi:hypothetical protein